MGDLTRRRRPDPGSIRTQHSTRPHRRPPSAEFVPPTPADARRSRLQSAQCGVVRAISAEFRPMARFCASRGRTSPSVVARCARLAHQRALVGAT
jgi:hypothetical protein